MFGQRKACILTCFWIKNDKYAYLLIPRQNKVFKKSRFPICKLINLGGFEFPRLPKELNKLLAASSYNL